MRELLRPMLAKLIHAVRTVKIGHRICDSSLCVWACGRGAAIANLRFGARALVFVHEYNGRSMYLWGEHDPRITAVMQAVLRPGDTSLDIGANFGVTGLFAAKAVGPSGKVHLFEPQPLIAQCLRTSLMINGYENAVVHECALSNETGAGKMYIVDPNNLGMSTLLDEASNPRSQQITVRLEAAGNYIESLECGPVRLIKLDVEGHEGTILKSLRDWIIQMQPPVILFECHHQSHDFWHQESVSVLYNAGFVLFGYNFDPYWKTQLCQVAQTNQNPLGYDFVAIHRSFLAGPDLSLLKAMINC